METISVADSDVRSGSGNRLDLDVAAARYRCGGELVAAALLQKLQYRCGGELWYMPAPPGTHRESTWVMRNGAAVPAQEQAPPANGCRAKQAPLPAWNGAGAARLGNRLLIVSG